MKKSISRIIKKYDLKENLECLFSIENKNNPNLPPEYKGKKDFVYNSLKYIPKIEKLVRKQTNIKLGKVNIVSVFGGIDFFWNTKEYSLLLYVPENSSNKYCMIDEHAELLIKGTLD